MANARHDLGMAAEEAVAAWLERLGWSILGRRVRSPHGGEVDLIARDPAGVLVAIEVRARRTARTGDGSEAIDRRRTGRIGRKLGAFARARGDGHRGVRIDLVSVSPQPGDEGRWRLRRTPGIGDW